MSYRLYWTGIHKMCNQCANQITITSQNTVSTRCIKFVVPVKNVIVYELTTTARNDYTKCGSNAKYFVDKHVDINPYKNETEK